MVSPFGQFFFKYKFINHLFIIWGAGGSLITPGFCELPCHAASKYLKEEIPTGFVVLTSAHASLAAYLKFKDSPEVEEWISGPFYKVICRINDKEFEKAKEYPDHIVLTESALDNKEVTMAFKPRREWPRVFKFLRMYR